MPYPLDRESDPVDSVKLGSVLSWFEEEEKPWELGKYRHLKNQKETEQFVFLVSSNSPGILYES